MPRINETPRINGELRDDNVTANISVTYGDEGNDATESANGADTSCGGTGDNYLATFDLVGITAPFSRTLEPNNLDDRPNDFLDGGDGADQTNGDSRYGGDDADTVFGAAERNIQRN